VRDAGGLEAALAHPLNLFSYGSDSDLATLAAGYAASISRRHPFVDGNKRTAFMVAYVFLRQNGWRLEADEVEVVHVVRALADGELDEVGFATWLRQVAVAV
jgi:death-on-curing protein